MKTKILILIVLIMLFALFGTSVGVVSGLAAVDLSVYSDILVPSWQDWSYGGSNINYANSSPVYDGTNSIAVIYTQGWSGFQLGYHGENLDVSAYDTFRFWIHGGSAGGQKILLQIGSLEQTITPQANIWTKVDVPLLSLGSPREVYSITWFNDTDGSQAAFYLDDIAFVDSGATPPPTLPPGTGPALSVNATAGQHPISPYIYGINYASEAIASDLRLPVRRWGGNSTSRYNWQNGFTNTGSDWYYENVLNENADDFISQDRRTGTKTIMTMPLIGWVSKNSPISHPYACGFRISKYGSQQDADWNWDPDCGNGNHTNGTPITGNDPLDTSIAITSNYATGWVNHLTATFGTAANGGVMFYNLDNEPMLWNSTHRDVHPDATTYDEMRDRTWAYAAAIKAADPTAKTLGPVVWGWCAYFYSAADGCSPGADRQAHGNVDFVEWYLQQMHTYEQQHGVRLVDYVDVHIYPQIDGVYSDSLGSADVQAKRLRSTRQLWDTTYVHEGWIGQPVYLIPRMKQWVASDYPGTKLAITEYNWGALGYMNGALAQADLLGIFGRERLDLATLWGPPENANAPAIFAFRMYRNYDGQGSAFGETAIQAASVDQEKLAVYAAQRNRDQALTIMVINKTGQSLTSALTLTNFQPGTAAKVYRYSAANLTAIVHEPDQAVSTGGFSATFPENSITLIVIPPSAYTISGNAGLANAGLSYMDGTPKTATADGSGNYSFTVPYNWSGTVTPWKSGYGFTPASRTYANVLADQNGQDYTATSCSTTDVTIAGSLSGSYCLTSGQSTRQSYAANNGPVKVANTGGTSILTAQRILYYGTGASPTSFVEMMGLPDGQLDTIYWFPWYKNDGIVDTQIRIGNVSASTATVHIYVAGVEVTGSPFTLTTSGAGQSQRLSFALNDGSVKIVSDQNIVATERLIYFNSGVPVSFSEMLGLPNSQLSNTYWFPWYKNVGDGIDTQLRIGNVSASTATVHIYIAGVEVMGSPFTLTASGSGQSQRLSFPINNGPVKIVSDVNIVAAQRILYYAGGVPTSFVETMGIPDSQLGTTHWFPWYKNDGIVDTQLRIGNVSGLAASVHVYIGAAEMAGSPFALTATGAEQSLRLSFTANDGPVKIVSDQNIVTSERLIYFNSGVPVSFSEMMGLPDSQLSNTYWLPWYKNIGEIDTQLRFGVP